jgi:mRNA degradation ribonuclease J1/J2
MVDKVSPKFHAEIIVVLFDEYQELRKVMDRVGILLSDASAEHIGAVGKYLPVDLMRVIQRRTLRAA